MKMYKQLVITFFKIGLLTIGGGYAMLPMMQKELIDRKGWVSEKELLDYYAIGQSTPGIIAINTATFVGYKQKGVWGGLLATLGMVLPSWISIVGILMLLSNFSENIYVQKAFHGIRVVVVVLIIDAVIEMSKKVVKKRIDVILLLIAFVLVVALGIAPPYIILVASVMGVVVTGVSVASLKKASEKKKGDHDPS